MAADQQPVRLGWFRAERLCVVCFRSRAGANFILVAEAENFARSAGRQVARLVAVIRAGRIDIVVSSIDMVSNGNNVGIASRSRKFDRYRIGKLQVAQRPYHQVNRP
jgi:hypothetical protein